MHAVPCTQYLHLLALGRRHNIHAMTFIGANVEALPQNSTDPSIGYGQPVLGPIPLSEAHRYVSYGNDWTLRCFHQLRKNLKHLSLDQETTLGNGHHLRF